MTPREAEQLDPGIRDLVLMLRAEGFETTDSGDGVSKPKDWYQSGEAMPFPNIAATVERDAMYAEASRMFGLLQRHDGDGWEVEATYFASSDTCLLLATKPNDSHLAASLTVETPDQWKPLETLCEKATPGPWKAGSTPRFAVVTNGDGWIAEAQSDDAAFIAAARTAVPELLRALKGISEENKELRQRDRVLSRQIERRACGRDEGSYALLRENAELAVHRDSLTVEVERLKGEKWQPIETAPEATPVLVWLPNAGIYSAMRTGRDWWLQRESQICYPSAWLPIPAAPAPREEAK